jgi:type IV pilus assembly protein PilF
MRTAAWRAVRRLEIGLMIAAMLGGCQTEESIRKATGYYQEGLANMETDRRQAFVSFQKAVQLNPSHREAHYYLAHLYTLQTKYPQAVAELREVLAIDPDYAEAHNYLGQVLEAQGQWRDAVVEYRTALRNPLYATPDIALYRLGRALAHEGEYEPAMTALEDAIRITPPSQPLAPVLLELARVYIKLGYTSKAREALHEVTKLEKTGANAVAAEALMRELTPSMDIVR